ncbi:hypothetical protein N7455_000932 [Penicillium solitum]|uniref:uncharacterized protein n=1 Tax=Penicillium solitum TaxID=60172 RepID=UPI0032C49878|nr:hypothetical protein N7536_006587 [Penicillium majusculum]KAJ5877467.1 hypothetical protein N7455_000932 [Penicillium solitum]
MTTLNLTFMPSLSIWINNIHQSGRGGLGPQDNRQTASTSLTVAGFTASGQSEDWSVNHLDHPPRSSIHPNQPSTRINNIHSLTVEGFGFRTIGRLVTTTQSTPFEHPLPSSASINPPKQPFPV